VTRIRNITHILVLCSIIFGFACSSSTSVINDGFGDYLLVPAGEFSMGDHFNEGHSDEIPVHKVYLDAYYIGKYKVTNKEYSKFIHAGGYDESSYWSGESLGQFGTEPELWNIKEHFGGGLPGNDNYPVVGISWFEAQAYCRWLSQKTGNIYRLPTEAEWEKAARGLEPRRYAWGDEIDSSYSNYDSGQNREQMGLTPVGYYNGSDRSGFKTSDNVSPYGAYDMTGNTFEWCSDWYGRAYYATAASRNPLGPATGSSRVLRSAGYIDSAYYQRAASRHKRGAHLKNHATGFRCVREHSPGRQDP